MSPIPAWLERLAEAAPEAAAIVAPGRPPLTFEQLFDTTQRLAGGLHKRGVSVGDRIALVVNNGPAALTGFMGISSACACAPLNPAYRTAEFDFYLRDLGAQAVVIESGIDSPVRDVARALGIEILEFDATDHELIAASGDIRGASGLPADTDVALVLHTSGTTARPKVVPLRHRELVASATNIAATLALDPSDRCLNVMPLFHIHGIVGAALASLSAGASVACTPGFHPVRFFSWVDEVEPTWYTAVPTMHQALLARARERPELVERARFRLIRSSSAALAPAVFTELEATFRAPVIEAYGMTEAAHQMASNPLPPRLRKPGSVGPAAGPKIAILDEHGRRVPAGVIGEVAVRGPTVFSGYQDNSAANEEAFVEGWFRTGDQGLLDEDGYLFLRGRLKEIINRGGEKISPLEIDNVLLLHPAVAEAVCFGFPDPRLGEEVGAAVVLRAHCAATEHEIQEFVASKVADFKVPRLVRFVDEIPKGSTGKLRRMELAEELGIDHARRSSIEPTYEPPRTDLERALAQEFGTVLGQDLVGRHDNFFDAGGDSILAVELIVRLRQSGLCRSDAPLAALLWASTPALLAAWVETGSDTRPPVLIPMVPVDRDSAGAPLFLIHGGAGDVVEFVPLADRLGADHPLHCFRARALDAPEPSELDLTEMAVEYVDALTDLGPDEPIHLAGICGSAPIAFEMARLLEARGRALAPLVLIDPLPGAWEGQSPIATAVVRSRVFERVHSSVRQGWIHRLGPRLNKLRQGDAARMLRDFVRARARRRQPTGAPANPAVNDITGSFTDARHRYTYRPHHGGLVVMHTRRFPTPKRLWSRLAPDGLRWIELPVLHSQMLSRQNAAQLAILADALAGVIESETTRGEGSRLPVEAAGLPERPLPGGDASQRAKTAPAGDPAHRRGPWTLFRSRTTRGGPCQRSSTVRWS